MTARTTVPEGKKPAPSVLARFWASVQKTDSCWFWTGAPNPDGYGKILVNGERISAHRFAFLAFNGPIAPGLEVDHVCHSKDTSCPGGRGCRHRLCVNPAHLEAVTHRENQLRGRAPSAVNARKTHCGKGHPFNAANTRIDASGARRCLTCAAAATARYRARKRAAAGD